MHQCRRSWITCSGICLRRRSKRRNERKSCKESLNLAHRVLSQDQRILRRHRQRNSSRFKNRQVIQRVKVAASKRRRVGSRQCSHNLMERVGREDDWTLTRLRAAIARMVEKRIIRLPRCLVKLRRDR